MLRKLNYQRYLKLNSIFESIYYFKKEIHTLCFDISESNIF